MASAAVGCRAQPWTEHIIMLAQTVLSRLQASTIFSIFASPLPSLIASLTEIADLATLD